MQKQNIKKIAGLMAFLAAATPVAVFGQEAAGTFDQSYGYYNCPRNVTFYGTVLSTNGAYSASVMSDSGREYNVRTNNAAFYDSYGNVISRYSLDQNDRVKVFGTRPSYYYNSDTVYATTITVYNQYSYTY